MLNGEFGKKRRKPKSLNPKVGEVCSAAHVSEILAASTVTEETPEETPEEPPNYDYNFLLNRIPYEDISVPSGVLSVSTAKLEIKMLARKTVIENFDSWIVSITKTRPDGFDLRQKHLYGYIVKELCCVGFIGNGKLTLRGRFPQKRLESLLRKYIVAFHNCSSCRGVKVVLNKSQATRALYNYCDVCKVTDFLPDY